MSKIFKGGVPYGPDVERLKAAFPTPDEGIVIQHSELEKLLSLDRGSGRYYGVCNSWRRMLMRERNVDSKWIQGTGLKILPPDERLSVSEGDIRKGIKKTLRGTKRMAYTPRDRLDQVGQARYDHQMMIGGKIRQSLDDAKKQLSIDIAPVQSLPKPKLVAGSR